jgi:enolase
MSTAATVERLRVRGVLDSRGNPTVEAEIDLHGGGRGRAAAPLAIAPGERERDRGQLREIGPQTDAAGFTDLLDAIERHPFSDQRALDNLLEELPATRRRADLRMAISLAFCRARLEHGRGSLVSEIARLAQTTPAIPRPLVNVFSGGIHAPRGDLPYQQIMLAPDLGSLLANVRAGLAIYGMVESQLAASGPVRYSSSSGMIVSGACPERLLEMLAAAIDRHARGDEVAIGLDVAAEHLASEPGRYCLAGERIDSQELTERHLRMLHDYPVAYLEDPFAPQDTDSWHRLRRDRPPDTKVFGDDLFATTDSLLDDQLADGLVVKISHVGCLTTALTAAHSALEDGMSLCVSHRSGETDDNMICDLATALGADFIKLGGPRRGDRTARYNELLRLSEVWGAGCQQRRNGGER